MFTNINNNIETLYTRASGLSMAFIIDADEWHYSAYFLQSHIYCFENTLRYDVSGFAVWDTIDFVKGEKTVFQSISLQQMRSVWNQMQDHGFTK